MKQKFESKSPASEKSVNMIERMVQHLRMLAQHIIHPEEDEIDIKDSEGFTMTKETAE